MQVPAGTAFAALTVVEEVARSGQNRRFLCRCACGRETVKFLNNLRLGRSKSCGCRDERGVAARAQIVAERRGRAQESDQGRICHTCKEWQTWSNFCQDLRRSRGKASNCMRCSHWRSIKASYGLTRAEWEWLRDSQQRRCALCTEVDSVSLAVDHDHSCCGRARACKRCIRGMLCGVCNRMLGHVERKPALRDRFADYLQRRPFGSTPIR